MHAWLTQDHEPMIFTCQPIPPVEPRVWPGGQTSLTVEEMEELLNPNSPPSSPSPSPPPIVENPTRLSSPLHPHAIGLVRPVELRREETTMTIPYCPRSPSTSPPPNREEASPTPSPPTPIPLDQRFQRRAYHPYRSPQSIRMSNSSTTSISSRQSGCQCSLHNIAVED